MNAALSGEENSEEMSKGSENKFNLTKQGGI